VAKVFPEFFHGSKYLFLSARLQVFPEYGMLCFLPATFIVAVVLVRVSFGLAHLYQWTDRKFSGLQIAPAAQMFQ